MTQRDPDLDAVDITAMGRYLEHGYPWADWDLLRDRAPVYRYEGRARFSPFWAITRHQDIRWISSHPELFSSTGVIRLDTDRGQGRLADYQRKRAERNGWDPDVALDMLYTDRPEHLDLRALAVRRFTPKAITRLADHLDTLAERFVARFVDLAQRAAPGPVDLVEELAVGIPIATICGLLGVPTDDWTTVRRWSDQTLLTPDLNHPDVRPGETASDVRRRAGQEYHAYRQQLIDQARAQPVPDEDDPDLVRRLAHARIDGQPLDDQRLHGYIELLVGGGNETTRNTITGGIRALLEHPDQAAVLAEHHAEVIETAVEEILRWVSPVIQFARTATTDVEVRGETIRRGDTVVLWYPSGNRDEREFPDPYRFDVRRTPNNHLTFGHGEHFCLGANLARWELRSTFRALAPHLAHLELAGPPDRLPGLHVGAVAHLPVRWSG